MARANALILILLVIGVLAATASGAPRLTSCGHVDAYVAAAAHRVSCNQARSIARSYLRGNHRPQHSPATVTRSTRRPGGGRNACDVAGL